MVNEKLLSIGQKLNVSGQDIKNIKDTKIKEKLSLITHPIITIILSIVTFILGISLGGGCTNCAGYPYAGGFGPLLASKKGTKSLIATLLLPIITFFVGYLVGQTFFGYAILYNVYKR